MYRVFSLMLKSFSREDLEDLYKLVKAKYKSTRPVEDLDLVLWSDLKTMFEPHVEDEIWKLQQRYQVLSWKLFDSCGVHCLSLQSGMIYMLGRIVGIKSLLNVVSITAALIDVNAAQSKLLLLEEVITASGITTAEGVNAASEEVSTAELVSTAYVICMRYFEVAVIIKEEGENWMLPIREYLLFGKLPSDPQKARKLRIKDLYKPRASLTRYTKNHALIQRCEACQIHSSISRKPKQEMTFITSTLHFSQCGIDIVGPLPMAPGGARFLVIAIDYFTKWVKAKPLVSTTEKHMETFIKVTNRDIVKGMERRLGKTHQGWIDELPQVVWVHMTTLKSSNGENPFSLVYGSKAVVPIEISVETKRIKEFEVRQYEKRRREDLDILEERREIASIREAYYKQKLEGYYNKCVQPSTFKPELALNLLLWCRISNPTIESSNKPPVKVEVPSELPKVSLVNASLKNLKIHLAQFDFVVKKRTTPDSCTEGMLVALNPLVLGYCKLGKAHIDYLKYTQEQADILRGISKGKEIVENFVHIPSAITIALGMFKLDLEPLPPRSCLYVQDTCPNAITPSAKKATVESSNTSDSNKPMLSSTGMKCSTSNCGSKPPGNKKNDRISQTPSRNKKNKVEAQPRKVNKVNHVVKPVCNVDVKHSLSNANSEILCATCNKSMFDGVHDKCLLDLVQNGNKRFPNCTLYLDSGCSKHMTGNHSQLMNFVSKFLGTVRFGNNQIARIMGYGDYQLGNVIISRVYYVEGLGHNLFSVGQFCDADLELAKDDLARGIPRLKFQKDHLCSAYALGKSKKSSHQPKAEDTNQEKLYLLHMDLCGSIRMASINEKRYILVIVDDYSRFTWVRFLKTKDEAPAAIIKSEAINTACYTQNRSLIRLRYNKTPYELMQDKKPDLSFFHVFGSFCYPTNDNEDMGKFDAKSDIRIFIGYAPAKKAFRIYNKRTCIITETIHVMFNELTTMASE
ncbi:retrovirus-related pol polyprotein from transposon TNT 1-94 [Tanacetum coccineum]|uniref:Retrovirus-related pol polyprotein from transposon TNT 1-94 n=1 Tax=Tanacetum coccineum TaxID=301880 RepID=A0ABQ5DZI8_9ASTR